MNAESATGARLPPTAPRIAAVLGLCLLAWNALLLLVWLGEYHLHPERLADAFHRFIVAREFAVAKLAGNWYRFLSAGAALAGLLVLVTAIGRRAGAWTRGARCLGAPGTVLVEFCLGFGVLGFLALGLGLAGILFAPPRLASFAVLAAMAGRALVRNGRNALAWRPRLGEAVRPLSPLGRAALAVAGVITVAHVFSIETAWDAMTYHLRLPDFYLYHHRIYDVWHNFYSQLPAHVEMLYALAVALEGDTLARFLNVSFGVLFLLAIGATARVLALPRAWAVLIVIASPLFLLLVTRSYADLGVGFYGALSILLMIRWRDSGSRAALVLAGAAAGIGMAAKYTGILVPLAVLAAAAPERRRPRLRGDLALFCLAALLPILAWLLKNWLLRGNPVAPFFGAHVGLFQADVPELALPFMGRPEFSTMRYGLLAKLEALYLDRGHMDAPLLPVVAGLLPLLVLRRAPGRLAFARRAALVFLALWAVLCAEIRFLLPIVPVLAVLLGGAAAPVIARGGIPGRGVRVALEAGVIAGAVFAAGTQWINFAPFSMPLGLESFRDKLELGLPPQPFMAYTRAFINARVPRSDRVLFASYFHSYYVERECLTDFHIGRGVITRLLRENPSPGALRRRFRQLGIGWILSTGHLANQFAHMPGYYDAPPEAWAAFKELLATRSEVAWQTNYFTLFRLGPRHAPAPLPAFPVYEVLAYRQAVLDLKSGRAGEAVAALASPPSLLRDVGRTYVLRGLAFDALHRYAEARDDFGHALACGTDTPELRAGLARALVVAGRNREALHHVTIARAQHPTSGYIASLAAMIHAELGNRDEARALIREAVRREPDVRQYLRLAAQFGATD